MLVHKATMGALDRLWTGQYIRGPDGVRRPADRPAVLSDVDDPESWWEIPDTGPLARTIRHYYPWLIPQLGPGGELVGVTVQRESPEEKAEVRAVREAMQKEASCRGYRCAGRVRPKNLMPFLSSHGENTPQIERSVAL